MHMMICFSTADPPSKMNPAILGPARKSNFGAILTQPECCAEWLHEENLGPLFLNFI